MKLATQYDMLSYVGSEIDEVKMDHLTFFKLFNKHWSSKSEHNSQQDDFDGHRLNEILSFDSNLDTLV